MARQNDTKALFLIQKNFSRSETGTLHGQLYQVIRKLVFEGALSSGTRLPSSRQLAETLGLSRHTVCTAFDDLLAEGYLRGRHGSGTYVSRHFHRSPNTSKKTAIPAAQPMSSRGLTILSTPQTPFVRDSSRSGKPTAFRVGLPAVDVFPYREWSRAMAAAWKDIMPGRLGYQTPLGLKPLREWIASYLGASRRLMCHPDQVVITGGSQSALDLCFRILLDPGEQVAIEDPGYLGARGAAQAACGSVKAISVDEQGLDVTQLKRINPQPRVVYVTPTHQFPLGITLSLRRRLDLVSWADEASAWIIEDDYDSEYRYGGRPFDPLAALDRRGRTIYIGTFSKVLFPAIRLGYLVLPPGLVDTFEAAHLSIDIHRPILEQVALVRFMEAGHFSRHLRRTKDVHAERRATLLAEAQHRLPELLHVHPAQAGLHLFGALPADSDDVAVADLAAQHGVEVWPLSIHAIEDHRKGLLLGYGGAPPYLIRQGAEKLARALADAAK